MLSMNSKNTTPNTMIKLGARQERILWALKGFNIDNANEKKNNMFKYWEYTAKSTYKFLNEYRNTVNPMLYPKQANGNYFSARYRGTVTPNKKAVTFEIIKQEFGNDVFKNVCDIDIEQNKDNRYDCKNIGEIFEHTETKELSNNQYEIKQYLAYTNEKGKVKKLIDEVRKHDIADGYLGLLFFIDKYRKGEIDLDQLEDLNDKR